MSQATVQIKILENTIKSIFFKLEYRLVKNRIVEYAAEHREPLNEFIRCAIHEAVE